MKANSVSLKGCKRHLKLFFVEKNFWEEEIMKMLKNGGRQLNQKVNMLFDKINAENNKKKITSS